jgi:AraC family transcriptional regulator of adaptative response / DNA-3-methyladenine glycosylase II
MLARDGRFDGLFFVAVKTTGVYCRPICPARTPARNRCEFYTRAAEAERAGFRACFRCRPELAPGTASVDALPSLVQAALTRIDAGFLNEASVSDLAKTLGVTSRHLRRAMRGELGLTPVELAQSRRLALAKQLLHDTHLPVAEVAFASGFSSLRRFNALFQSRFGRAPSSVRRHNGAARDAIALRLDYRAPFDWQALLSFLEKRALSGIEMVDDGEYRRTVAIDGTVGWIAVREESPALTARLSLSLTPKLPAVVDRLRALFDLDAQPQRVNEVLGRHRRLASLVRRRPGLRVPGAFDRFELAVRAILGQRVSVAAATTLARRLVDRFGLRIDVGMPGLDRLFPDAQTLASVEIEELVVVGLTQTRAAAIAALARAVSDGAIDLARPHQEVVDRLVELPGIGPWTAQYIAMRALGWPDAFVAGDVVVHKALGARTAREAETLANAWRPWRAYAVMHLWLSQSGERHVTNKNRELAGGRARANGR